LKTGNTKDAQNVSREKLRTSLLSASLNHFVKHPGTAWETPHTLAPKTHGWGLNITILKEEGKQNIFQASICGVPCMGI